MSDEKNLFEAMGVFQNISLAVAFTPNEVALFHVLLSTWNTARRPAVIEQWAGMTCQLSGLSEKTLPDARNKLLQRGVIFFEKKGQRGVPRYSLNALFETESPFSAVEKAHPIPPDLPAEIASKPGNSGRVSGGTQGVSYQGEGKLEEKKSPLTPKGEWDGIFPKGSLNKSKTEQKRTKVLRTNSQMCFIGKWFGRRDETLWSVAEAKALHELAPGKEEVKAMGDYRSKPYEYHRTNLAALLNNWSSDLDKARSLNSRKNEASKPNHGIRPV